MSNKDLKVAFPFTLILYFILSLVFFATSVLVILVAYYYLIGGFAN